MTYWYLLAAALISGAAAAVLWRRFSHTDRDGYIALTIVAAFVALGCLGTYINQTIDRATCMEKGRTMSLAVQYEFLSGCYVHVDGQLIPYDRWIQIRGVNAP